MHTAPQRAGAYSARAQPPPLFDPRGQEQARAGARGCARVHAGAYPHERVNVVDHCIHSVVFHSPLRYRGAEQKTHFIGNDNLSSSGPAGAAGVAVGAGVSSKVRERRPPVPRHLLEVVCPYPLRPVRGSDQPFDEFLPFADNGGERCNCCCITFAVIERGWRRTRQWRRNAQPHSGGRVGAARPLGPPGCQGRTARWSRCESICRSKMRARSTCAGRGIRGRRGSADEKPEDIGASRDSTLS